MCGEELAGFGPILFLDVGEDDLHRVGRAAQRAAGAVGQLFRQGAALFDGAALEHLDVDHRHFLLLLVQNLWSIAT